MFSPVSSPVAYYVRLVKKGVPVDSAIHIVRASPSYYTRPWKTIREALCGVTRGKNWQVGGWKVAIRRCDRHKIANATDLCEPCRVQNLIEELKFE